MKKRLDVVLVEKGFAPSREKAKAIIMSGIVFVDNQKADKAGMTIPEDAAVCRGKIYEAFNGVAAESDSQEISEIVRSQRI